LTALDQGISPIVCVGETLEDYRKGESDLVVEHMKECLKNVRREDIDKVIVCYEPIWAISSDKGKNPADADYANQMVMLLRQGLAAIYNRELAYEVPIIYGGSVDSSDVANYQNQPEINGVLVGSASLDANEFIKICDRIKENS
jgi:triosephosphate isomerase (TIM)